MQTATDCSITPSPKKHTVLCVDDEANVLNALKRLLRQESYTVLTTTDVEEGMQLLEKHTVQLVISDQRMPSVTGTEFLKQVKNKHPETVRVILSGYADMHSILGAINQGEIYRFVTKPWTDDDLRQAIQDCLNHYELSQQEFVMASKILEDNQRLHHFNKKLEELVLQQSPRVNLAQEILEGLPLPVIATSPEGMVLLINSAAREKFPNLCHLPAGSHVEDIFPANIAQRLTYFFEDKLTSLNEPIAWGDWCGTLQIHRITASGTQHNLGISIIFSECTRL